VGSDHRKHERLKAKSEIFAAFLMPNEMIVVGRVLDLSLGGAGVKYLATRKLKSGPASIKIFGMDSLHMERIQSTVVYDVEIAEESWSIPSMRRCGIKFGRFGLKGKTKLKELMQVHVGGKHAGVDDRVLRRSVIRRNDRVGKSPLQPFDKRVRDRILNKGVSGGDES
jgi:hypothetical protein